MLGEMASGIAHEINQPLTAIALFSQAGKRLLEKGQLSRIPEILEKLNQHSLRAGAVIDRMQMFARRGENVKETTDCNKLISDVVEFAEAESRLRDIQIRVELAKELPSIMVDNVQIQQVTLNLLRNGMQAMQATSLDEAVPIVVRTRLSGDGEVEISVIDCGGGVAEEIVDELFKPFSTTKESGMGMGLSICSEIVTSHGGQLDFRNNDDGGATFFFTLPAAALGI
jgi:two-component system sensor kinase FixL